MTKETKYGTIYEMYCEKTGKYYVGATTEKLNIRKGKHNYDSKRSNTELSQDIREYGIDSFTIKPIVTASTPQQLSYLEDYHIIEYALLGKPVYKQNKGGIGYDENKRASIRKQWQDPEYRKSKIRSMSTVKDADCILMILINDKCEIIGELFGVSISHVSRLKRGTRRNYLLEIIDKHFNGVSLTLEQAERLKGITEISELKSSIEAL